MVSFVPLYSSFMSPASPPAETPPTASPDRLEALIAAAEQLFLSKGYHNTTMADIARQAGMSKRTVYTLVPSKADLFGELLAHQRQTRLQFTEPPPGASLEDTLCATLAALAQFLLDPVQISMTRLLITEFSHDPDFTQSFLAGRMRKGKTHLQGCLVEIAIAQGASPEMAAEMSGMLFGMALGEFVFGVLCGLRTVPAPKVLNTRIRTAVKMFLAGLQALKAEEQ